MKKLLGYQIADQFGENIQGDNHDPSGLPSFRILSADEAWAIMETFGKSRVLLLQPIFEGDVEEPTFADEASISAAWPADEPHVIDCDPAAIAAIMIKSACSEVPYRDRDVDDTNWSPNSAEIAFWDRVAENADRIAKWAINGLSITRRAIRMPTVSTESEPANTL